MESRLRTCSEVVAPRRMDTLDRPTALELLAGVSLGRIVFTRNALPAIRPVNHALIDGRVMIRTHDGAALTSTVDGTGTVVAYEADDIDPHTHLGWSVIVTGFADIVRDPAALARYEAALVPWVDQVMEHIVAIRLDEVTGFRITAAD